MALPTAQDLQNEISAIQALISQHLIDMANGSPDLQFTLPTGTSVNAAGYLDYLMQRRTAACRNYQSFFPEASVSIGR